MIIKIDYARSEGGYEYDIFVNGELKYYGGLPQMKFNLPKNILNGKKLVVCNTDEDSFLMTSFIQIAKIFNIERKNLEQVGSFFQKEISYNKKTMFAYDVTKGTTRHLPIYLENEQIAEILKPGYTDELLVDCDYFLVYLLDEFSEFERLFSLFAIYFAYEDYARGKKNNSLKISISLSGISFSKKLSTGKSLGKNFGLIWSPDDKYYDKKWIRNNFNEIDVILT